MSMGWAGCGAERAHGIFAPFPLFFCPARERREKAIVSEDARESQTEEVESKWLKGVPSHKRARLHNNLKSKYLIIERKVFELYFIVISSSVMLIEMPHFSVGKLLLHHYKSHLAHISE